MVKTLALGLAVVLLTSVNAVAQTVTIYGTVRDRVSGEPLPSATVSVLSTKIGAVADKQGNYRIESLPIGEYQIRASVVGYEPEIKRLVIRATQQIDFSLKPLSVEQSEIVVQAERERAILQESSQAIATLSQAELDKHRGQTLGETLRELPGVTILQTGPSISKPVVRGMHSQRVLVLNAGVRQEGQQWGAEHAPEIDPFAAAKIEVLKGAASVEYGADAIGGVIRIEPRPLPIDPQLKGELNLNLFGNNAQGAGSGLVEGKLGEHIGWRVQASYRRAGDAAAPQYFLNNTGFAELNVSILTGYKADWGEISAYYSRFSTELGILKSAHIGNVTDLVNSMQRLQPFFIEPFSYAIDFPRQSISHDLISLRANVQTSEFGKVQINYGYQQNVRQEFDAHVPLGTDRSRRNIPAFDLTLFTHTAEVRWNHHPIGNFLGTVGAALTVQSNYNLGRTALIPNFSATTAGIFWREEWVSENWTLNAGIRYDIRWQSASPFGSSRIAQQLARGEIPNRQTFQTVTGALGAIWQFASEWSLALNAATAWRPPSINELYSDGVHHGTAQYEIGNPALGVERSFGLDATLRHIGQRTRLELSLYRNAIENFIYLFPQVEPVITIRGAFPAFAYQQAPAVLHGIDGFFEWKVTETLQLYSSLSVVRAWNEARHEPLINMPSDRLIAGAHLDLPEFFGTEKSYLEISTTLVRRQDQYPRLEVPSVLPPAVSDPEAYQFYVQHLTLPPAGYGLLNLSSGTEFSLFGRRATFVISIYNVLDQRYRDYLSRYRYFADDAGRNVIVRWQMDF